MTESASSRDVSNRGAKAIWTKGFERKRYDRVPTAIRSKSLDEDALEVSKARPVRPRGAQALAQLAGGSVTPQRCHIDVRIGELG